MSTDFSKVAADEPQIDPVKFSLWVAGWIWVVPLAFAGGAYFSESVRIFSSFLFVPLVIAGVPLGAAIGMYYGLKGIRLYGGGIAIAGFVLNAAAVIALAAAAWYFFGR
jgi:hypothetical protein